MSDVTTRFLQTLNDRGTADVAAYLAVVRDLAGGDPEAGRITVTPSDPPVHRLVLATAAGLAVVHVRYHDSARSGWDVEAILHDWESVRGLELRSFVRAEHGTGFPAWSLTLQNPAIDIRGHAEEDTRALAAAILRHKGGSVVGGVPHGPSAEAPAPEDAPSANA